MPASARRVQVRRRGPCCWERSRYSEKELWEGEDVKSAGRAAVGLAGWGWGVWSTDARIVVGG